MNRFHYEIKEAIKTLAMSTDLISWESQKLTEIQITSIVREINDLQRIFSTIVAVDNRARDFNSHFSILKGRAPNGIDELMDIRDAIRSMSVPEVKNRLEIALRKIEVYQEKESLDDFEIYDYERTSLYGIERREYLFNSDSARDNLYRLIGSLRLNSEINMLITNSGYYNDFFIDFIEKRPIDLQSTKINVYSNVLRSAIQSGHINNVMRVCVNLVDLKTDAARYDVMWYASDFQRLAYDADRSEYAKNSDQTLIRKSMRLTRKGGLYIASVPALLLDRKILKYFYTALDDIHIFLESRQYGVICVYGIRKHNTQVPINVEERKEVEDFINNVWHERDERVPDPVFRRPHSLPLGFEAVQKFQGKRISMAEVEPFAKKSTLYNTLIDKLANPERHEIRPMLPLTKGQLGMVLTSGVLNGVVKENDDAGHLIKGVATKEVVSTQEEGTSGEIIEKNVYRNKIELSMLLPDGTFTELS